MMRGVFANVRRAASLSRAPVGLLIVALSACSTTAKPEAIVSRLLRSFNEKDVNTILTCIDPKQERLFRASFRLVEKLSGGRLPMENLFEMAPGLFQLSQDKLGQDWGLRDIQVRPGTVASGDAEVMVVLTIWQRSGGVEKAERQVLWFALHEFEEQGWRVTGIRTP